MLAVGRLFAFIDNLLGFSAAILTRYLLSYYYTFIRYTRAVNCELWYVKWSLGQNRATGESGPRRMGFLSCKGR
jgi:hypothetical protein